MGDLDFPNLDQAAHNRAEHSVLPSYIGSSPGTITHAKTLQSGDVRIAEDSCCDSDESLDSVSSKVQSKSQHQVLSSADKL
jgi:hypothetical protein